MADIAYAKCNLTTPGGTRDFYFRQDSVGDRGVIDQIFVKHDYNLAHFPLYKKFLAYAEARKAAGLTNLIIDAGANIGASPIHFASEYPGSIVVAIEPERGNAELLQKNCAGLDTIRVVQAAIGSEPCRMFLSDPGRSDWGFMTSESEGLYEVDVITVDKILADFPSEKYAPLICKIDIEGGEKSLFEKNTGWVEKFPLLIIETHDWMIPGQAVARNFLKTVVQYNFDFLHRGENIFCFNNDLL